MPDIQKILHPTDFSVNARDAFESACSLARENHATLIVLHVMMPSVSPLEQPVPDPHQPAELQGSIASLPWPQPPDSQIRVDHRVAEGDPAEEVLRLAERLQCDLIVMGTHGRSGLARVLTGSVAEEVLRKSSCPVLVVRAALHAKPHAQSEAVANPGDVVDAGPLGSSLPSGRSRTLVQSTDLEVVRLIVHSGEEVPNRTNKGESIIQCLEGRVALTALGKRQFLGPGNLIVLPARERHTIEGIESASLLLTIVDRRS